MKVPQIQSLISVYDGRKSFCTVRQFLEETLITRQSFEIPTNRYQIRIKDIKLDNFDQNIFLVQLWAE